MSAPQDTATMDPWTLLRLAKGERSLFGFCIGHHELGGLSWTLSTPVVHLDERAGVARTRSGTLYRLGRRVSPHNLPDREASVALQELSEARNPSSREARLWLTACKTARWLGLPAPVWSDAAAAEAFLEEHRAAYLELRATSGEQAAPKDPGPRPAGKRHSVDGWAEGGWGTGFGLPPANGGVIFRAARRGVPVTVARADRGELIALAAPARSTEIRNDLEDWNFVAIRGLAKGTELHALGWRVALASEWITSPIAVVSLWPTAIETTSGHAYRLATPDGARMKPALLEHLRYALRSWGFEGITPA